MSIFNLPDLGEGLTEAEIREWHVKVGDVVTIHQPLVSVETAKALVEVPSPQAGKIMKLYGKPGEFIQTHTPLVEFDTGSDKGSVVGRLEENTAVLKEEHMIIGSQKKADNTIKAIPAVRAYAKEHGIDLQTITPTGPQGQVTLNDVKNYETKGDTLHGMRHSMEIIMEKSHHEIVPVTLTDDADITAIGNNADVTVHVIQALVAAIKEEPILNAWFHSKTKTLEKITDIHLGLAVDTNDGLFVPVLKNIANLTASDLREKINQLKKSVNDRTLKVNDMEGATFTLTNFGLFAGRYATPVIVPPMVAILACGRARAMPAVYQNQIAIRTMLPLSLTFDHRVVTGGEASRFLGVMLKQLEGQS